MNNDILGTAQNTIQKMIFNPPHDISGDDWSREFSKRNRLSHNRQVHNRKEVDVYLLVYRVYGTSENKAGVQFVKLSSAIMEFR